MKEIIIAYDENTEASPVMGEWVRELVRCKHCKHFDGLNCKVNDITNIMDTNWFCADGERK